MEQLIDNGKAAELLGISPFSLRGKVSRREVPFIKIGRRVLFSPTALAEFIRENSVAPKPRNKSE